MIKLQSDKLALIGLALSMLLSSLAISTVNVALPTLSVIFKSSFQEIQWLVLSYLLTLTVMTVSVGKIGDIIGKKRVLLFGILLFSISSALCSLSHYLWLLIFFRFLQGIGASAMMVFSLALIGEVVPKEKTGSAMGILGTSSALGTAMGPSFGGFLISTFNWQFIFIVPVPFCIVAFFLIKRSIINKTEFNKPNKIEFDYFGTLLLILSVALYALTMTIGKGHFHTFNYILLIASIVFLSFFIATELKVKSPIINLSIFRDRFLNLSLISSAVVSAVLMTTLVVGAFYLTYGLKLNTSFVGIIMSVGPFIVIISGIPSGYLTDKFGAKRISNIGLLGITIGSFIFSITPISLGIIGYIIPLAITTFGYALFQTSNNTSILKNVEQGKRGVISGILSLSRNLGLITGASVMGAIFYSTTGTSEIIKLTPQSASAGLHSTFSVAVISVSVVLIVSIVSTRKSVKILSN